MSTNLIPTGGLRTAMIAPVPRLELAAALGEPRAAVGFFLCCRDTAQLLPFTQEFLRNNNNPSPTHIL